MFPADHSWLVSTLWDDDWSRIDGSTTLVESRSCSIPRWRRPW